MNKVNFYLLKQQGRTLCPIRLRYHHRHGPLNMYVGFSIEAKNWNKKRQRCKLVAGFYEAQAINDYLNEIERKLRITFAEFRAKDISPTNEQLQAALTIRKTQNSVWLVDFIGKVIERKRYAIKDISLRKYFNLVTVIKEYEQQSTKIRMQDVTLNFYTEFLSWCFNEKEYQDNTAGKIISTLRTVCKEAKDQHGIETPYLKFHKPSARVDAIYLTTKEVEVVGKSKVSKSLERHRDLFIIACLTGVRYEDYPKINTGNIKQVSTPSGGTADIFEFATSKTGQRVAIPVSGVVRGILEKYNGKLPRPASNQKINDYLKEICKASGINDSITKTISIGGKKTTETLKKWQQVSSHTARRSFATNAYLAGVPLLSISRILGHADEKTTLKYIKLSNIDDARGLSDLDFFK